MEYEYSLVGVCWVGIQSLLTKIRIQERTALVPLQFVNNGSTGGLCGEMKPKLATLELVSE